PCCRDSLIPFAYGAIAIVPVGISSHAWYQDYWNQNSLNAHRRVEMKPNFACLLRSLLVGCALALVTGNISANAAPPGTVVAWGGNNYGQTNVPIGLSGVTATAAGGLHTVALKSDGTVVAWGYNGSGETTVPAGLSGVTAITAGGYHTVALKSDGTVVA